MIYTRRRKGESQPARQPVSLARRVSGWTSSLLATGIVLVAAMGVGRQLVQWWRVDPPPAPVPGTVGIPEAGAEQPLQIHFGRYSLRRIEVEGDLPAVIEQLKAQCRAVAQRARPPQTEPSEGERRFLERIAGREPLEEDGNWQIYQFEGKLPLLVAVAAEPAGSSSSPSEESGRPQYRVVAWGLAMPGDDESCTLLVYEVQTPSGQDLQGADLALPAQFRRTLTLSGQAGETTIGFSFGGVVQRACAALDAALQSSQGWVSTGWRQSAGVWHNRYRKSGRRLDIQLFDDGRGGTSGLAVLVEQP